MGDSLVESKGIIVAREDAERVKEKLISLNLLDGSRKAARTGEKVIFPLSPGAEKDLKLHSIPGTEMVTHEFEARSTRPRSIQDLLEAVLTPEELELIGSSYDLVGRIAIIDLPPELAGKRKEIGNALLSWLPAETVAIKISETSGSSRVRGLEVIAGERTLRTTHRENGLRFSVDLSRVFFNPRLGTERLRVARAHRRSELVIDMFAGVGPFSITISSFSGVEDHSIFAIDSNMYAIEHLIRNIDLNSAPNVKAIRGDAKRETARIAGEHGLADGIIMNLPKSSNTYLGSAVGALREGGVLHYYRLLSKADPLGEIKRELQPWGQFEVRDWRQVESYSPSRSIFVADAVLSDPA